MESLRLSMGENAPSLKAIPLELRRSGRWLVWKYGEVKPNGKKPKLPCDPATGTPHDKLDPKIWLTFDEAQKIVIGGHFAGCGLLVSSPWLGVDIDRVRNLENGQTEQWALDLIKHLNSYTELSP